MLSRSSQSSPSSPESPFWKKFVGGICFGSPTTTHCFALAITPIASQTGICDASSKTTMSNAASGGRYCATERGLIRKQGLRRPTMPRASARMRRTGFWRAFLAHSRRMTPSSHPSGQSPSLPCGRKEARRARTACLTSSAYSASSRRNSIICSSRRSPANEARDGSARSVSSSVRSSIERSNTSSACSGEMSPLSRACANAEPASLRSAAAEAR